MSRSYKPSHRVGRKRGTATIALTAAAAVVVIGGVAGAVTLTSGNHKNDSLASASSSEGATAPAAAAVQPSFTTASVTPSLSRTHPGSGPTGPASSPTGSASSPAASPATSQSSVPRNSDGRTLTLGGSGVQGSWPAGRQYPAAAVTVSGGQGPYTWRASGLPSGLTATPEGSKLAVSGTPAQSGSFILKVSVSDSATPPATGSESLPIDIAPSQNQGTLAIADSLSVTDTVGDTVDIGTTASGGAGAYAWTVTGLPSWVTASSGGYDDAAVSITGVANAPGTYPFTVSLSDSGQPRQILTESYTLTVLQPNSEQWSVEPLNPTQTTLYTPYSGSLAATNGVTVTWAVTAGALPPGLSLNSQTGTISGTPTEQGLFNFSVVATDGATGASKQGGTYNFVVNPAGH